MRPVDELTDEEKDAAYGHFETYRQGRDDERKRIVAWLRNRAEEVKLVDGSQCAEWGAVHLAMAAKLLEAGKP